MESEIEFQSEELDALRLKLSTLRELMIHENEVSEFRTNLASLVRASECQLSNIIVEETYERPWKIGAGLHQTGDAVDPDDFEELPYILQTRPVKTEVTGVFERIQEFIESVKQLPQIMRTTSLRLRREDSLSVRLNWTIELFCVVSAPEPEWEDE